jgi:hypothetical protein
MVVNHYHDNDIIIDKQEREMKSLRAENPSLKFSQLKQKLWEMWHDSEENPRVAAAADAAQRDIEAARTAKGPPRNKDDDDE